MSKTISFAVTNLKFILSIAYTFTLSARFTVDGAIAIMGPV